MVREPHTDEILGVLTGLEIHVFVVCLLCGEKLVSLLRLMIIL